MWDLSADLKPDNVLLARDAKAANGTRVVITDFGIARAFQSSHSDKGKQRGFDGTPLYISPEQVEGGRLDARTDIYSLGVVLYELLTGTPPFTGTSAVAVVAARVLRPPPDLRQARPDLPASVAQVVLRCLARNPAERFSRASEVAAALRRAAREVAEEPTLIRPAQAGMAPALASLPAAAARFPAALPASFEDALPPAQTIPPLPRASSQRTVAVLPLKNQGRSEDNYLAEGLTQDLIDTLASLKGVRVYSRGAVARWATGEVDALAAGRELGVELVVEGAIRRAGEHLRIPMRVIQVADGFQVFSERFDCHPGELLKVSDSLCSAVADVLRVQGALPRRAMPTEADTVEWYLRARHLYGLSDRASLEEGLRLFERVLALAPNEPALLMSYALARARMWFFGDQASSDKARAAAERVAAARPESGEPHLALAVVSFQGADLEAAVLALRRALALAPELADAHELLGRILIETGPLQRGLQHLAQALALDPGLSRCLVDQARTYALLGDYERAHAILADPQIEGRFAVPWFTRGRFCLWERNERRARKYLSEFEPDRGLYARPLRLLRLAAGQEKSDPREVLVEGVGSEQSSPRGRAFFHQLHVELFSFAGQRELAVRSLARSIDAGLTDLAWIERCPLVIALRSDPRVTALHRVVLQRALAVREAAGIPR